MNKQKNAWINLDNQTSLSCSWYFLDDFSQETIPDISLKIRYLLKKHLENIERIINIAIEKNDYTYFDLILVWQNCFNEKIEKIIRRGNRLKVDDVERIINEYHKWI